jgi:hypothetical protein
VNRLILFYTLDTDLLFSCVSTACKNCPKRLQFCWLYFGVELLSEISQSGCLRDVGDDLILFSSLLHGWQKDKPLSTTYLTRVRMINLPKKRENQSAVFLLPNKLVRFPGDDAPDKRPSGSWGPSQKMAELDNLATDSSFHLIGTSISRLSRLLDFLKKSVVPSRVRVEWRWSILQRLNLTSLSLVIDDPKLCC